MANEPLDKNKHTINTNVIVIYGVSKSVDMDTLTMYLENILNLNDLDEDDMIEEIRWSNLVQDTIFVRLKKPYDAEKLMRRFHRRQKLNKRHNETINSFNFIFDYLFKLIIFAFFYSSFFKEFLSFLELSRHK